MFYENTDFFKMYLVSSILLSGILLLIMTVYLYFNRQFLYKIFLSLILATLASIIIFAILSPLLFFAFVDIQVNHFSNGGTFTNILIGYTFAYCLIVFIMMSYYLKKHFLCTKWLPRIIFGMFLSSCWYIPFMPILSLLNF